MDSHIFYPMLAFVVSLLFQALYSKYIIEPNCPDKQPRAWLDHFILALPSSIAFAGVTYYFTSQWVPKKSNQSNGLGTMVAANGGNLRGNNMGRMSGNAYGRNAGGSAANLVPSQPAM